MDGWMDDGDDDSQSCRLVTLITPITPNVAFLVVSSFRVHF
jgi:hypothetical protein